MISGHHHCVTYKSKRDFYDQRPLFTGCIREATSIATKRSSVNTSVLKKFANFWVSHSVNENRPKSYIFVYFTLFILYNALSLAILH